MENIGSSIRGIYRDILKDGDNRVIYDSGWQANTIVDGCRKLLAAFMKNDDGSKGIRSLKVGQGKQEWDNNQTPTPENSAAALEDPAPFKIGAAKLKIAYLDGADVEVDEITNRIQVTATLGENEPPPVTGTGLSTYPLREFGLFGEYTDSSGVHEYMIDCIRHPVIHKDTSATLIRVVKLYF